ncbi:conserved hypothetical protein [uncultured Paludibacter sp.]|nr:conserved hypothetical protein [uncultured Paludibacter sp.]
MKKIYLIIICAVISTFTYTYAQRGFGHVEPTTSDFMKYGEIPTSLFTGKLSLDIPIYTISTNDFNIPVSLTYSSDGFKPAKRSGITGLDWFLNLGGSITREVYDRPDELLAGIENAGELSGFLYAVNQGNYNKDDVWNFNSNAIDANSSPSYYSLKPINNHYCEYDPDLFSFSFLGYSGQFMINNNGDAQCNIKGYKINIQGLNYQDKATRYIPEISTIIITTPDGYRYTFGGNLSALEFSINYKNGIQSDLSNVEGTIIPEPTILAWHLTEIKAPNGNTVKFYYEQDEDLYGNNSTYQLCTKPYWNVMSSSMQSESKIGEGVGLATKTVTIDRIETGDTKIIFDRSVETTFDNTSPQGWFFYGCGGDYNRAGYQIDNIRVKYKDEELYNYHFTYENVSKRRFLTAITKNNEFYYQFEYNHPLTGYPQPDDNSQIDLLWGYWVGTTATVDPENFDEITTIDGENDTLITILPPGWHGGTTINKAQYSLISKVTYPTKGYSKFYYEQNQSAKRVEYVFSESVDIYQNQLVSVKKQLINEEEVVGGFRIYKIENYDATELKKTEKKYVYRNDDDSGSGITYVFPPYHTLENGNIAVILGYNAMYNVGEPHIGYSEVKEYNSQNDSYIKHIFSDYSANPDENNAKFKLLSANEADINLWFNAKANSYSSATQKRGKLIGKTYYDTSLNQVKQERFDYSGVNYSLAQTPITMDDEPESDGSNYIVSFRYLSGGGVARKIYLENYPIEETIETVQGVTQNESYVYNNYDLLSEKKTADSNGNDIKTTYTYPFDYPSDVTLTKMTTNNLLNNVVEEKQYKNDVLLDTKKSTYSSPETSTGAYVNATYYSIGSNPLIQQKSFSNVNSELSPMVVTDIQSEINTVYLWGYNHQYIVAEIVNATYARVSSALGKSPEDFGVLDTDLALLSTLRSALPNAQVSTYTYKPLVGMTSKTDPRGVTTYYEYDSFNRLKCIKDKDGKVLQSFDYHYKQ